MSAHTDDHDDDRTGLLLTSLCWVALAVASFDAFLRPLPSGAAEAALVLAFLAGGIPAAPALPAVGEFCLPQHFSFDQPRR